jgi:cytidylate kinase
MGLITVTGQPGCRPEEAARISAQRLGFSLISHTQLAASIDSQYSGSGPIPDKAYADLMTSIVARQATENHLVVVADGAEMLIRHLPVCLRVQILAPENVRTGHVMLDRRVDRPTALGILHERDRDRSALRRRRFGRGTPLAESFDLILNAEHLDSEQQSEIMVRAAESRHLADLGFLSAEAEAHLQFQLRLRLARHGITPSAAPARRKQFAHPSEEVFANLLNFYQIAWEYEPRSFPVQWDAAGNVTEAFTPDFYLAEFDLYVELTTMKQSLVTKKNRKVKRLKELYPEINIQVFYQKDFENLIFKYGLAERLTTV